MIAKKGKKWYIIKWIDGKRKWIATGTENRTEAEMLERAMTLIKDGRKEKFIKIVNAIYGDAGGIERARLDSLLAEYPRLAQGLGVKVSAETMRKRLNAVGRLARWVEGATQAVQYADEISVPLAWRFIESLTGTTANTQRKVAGELSAVWEALQKRGLASGNPWKTAKPQKDSASQKHGRAFTLAEVQAILEACAEDWQRLAVMIGVYTGLRLGDIFSLRWEEVDFVGGQISHFKPLKTARHGLEVNLPLHPALIAYLGRFRASRGLVINAPCAPDRFGEYYFTKILAKAGIKGDSKTKVSFHCLRHTFATMLAGAGATEQERMELGGWSNAKTAQIYNHSTQRARALIDALPSL